MNLVIVESPNKIKAISKILGNDYTVLATAGHIRLIKPEFAYKTGIDIQHDFKISFEFDPSKSEFIKKIKTAAKTAKDIYVCSDGDREGESIADEVRSLLSDQSSKLHRAIFNEITAKAVTHAIQNPIPFDENMIKAAETRQILDRLIGFRTTPVVRYIGCESAGRVQSALLQLICKKEREIQGFIPTTYYDISINFKKSRSEYTAKLNSINGKHVDKITDKDRADKIVNDCNSGKYSVSDITNKQKEIQPKLPMTSAALQQIASNVLGFSPSKTMTCAQHLFEGAFITYHRTDAVRFSDDFIKVAKDKIEKEFGKKYYRGLVIPKEINDNAQNGHESIRPVDLENTPDKVSQLVDGPESKLYRLIYNHALASFFIPAKVNVTTVYIKNGDYVFTLSGKTIIEQSFLNFYNNDTEEVNLPEFKNGEELKNVTINSEEKQTQPPSRYSEAGLVKLMKDTGIGRPSTYASAIETLKKREYIEVVKKAVHVTSKGMKLDEAISKYFLSVINTQYTADMESDLDKISLGKEQKLDKLNEFWKDFEPVVVNAMSKIKEDKPAPVVYEGATCPNCGKPLYVKESKYGKFICCSGYPKCKFTASIGENGEMVIKEKKEAEDTGIICPRCKKGHVVKRVAKTSGKIFYGCNKFPKCKFTMSEAKFIETYSDKKEDEK